MSDNPIATTKPVRIVDGPITYVFTFRKDLDNNVVIDKIYSFDDFGSRYGETIGFASLPGIVKMRFWKLVG